MLEGFMQGFTLAQKNTESDNLSITDIRNKLSPFKNLIALLENQKPPLNQYIQQ